VLTFIEALPHVIKGGRIAMSDWENSQHWVTLWKGTLCLHEPNGSFSSWVISYADLISNNWVIVDA
jgi:hypothetical protein